MAQTCSFFSLCLPRGRVNSFLAAVSDSCRSGRAHYSSSMASAGGSSSGPSNTLPTTSSEDTSDEESRSSQTSQSATSMPDPAISAKFRERMQPCLQPLWEREPCPCCGRNMRLAADSVAKFRDFVRDSSADSLGGECTFSESERSVLLTDDFLRRLLIRCTGDFKRALERLMTARTVHRKYSLDTFVKCQLCANSSSGYHSFRQVGFDRLGRPVLYTCLNQDQETGTSVEQVHAYFLHLISVVREAEKTIPPNQHCLVMVFDTTGLGINQVRTDTVSQFGEMLRYFPARMSYSLLLNMSNLTRIMLKPVIHLTGHQDDVLIMSRRDMARQLNECFGPALVRWMLQEMERNMQPKMPFCSAGEPGQHDPRGEATYVRDYVTQQHPSGHRSHPSFAD